MKTHCFITQAIVILYVICFFSHPAQSFVTQEVMLASAPTLDQSQRSNNEKIVAPLENLSDSMPLSKQETNATLLQNTPKSIGMQSLKIESIIVNKEQIKPQSTTQDEQFLADLTAFTQKHINDNTLNIPLEKKKDLLLFMRMNFMHKKYTSFMQWFQTKDGKYSGKSESAKLRQEWETWLGVDIFHPYYKYKEARKIIKQKISFETPSMGGLKFDPEYKNGQIILTFRKKF